MSKVCAYIARDEDEDLYLYTSLPQKNIREGVWRSSDDDDYEIKIPNEWFPEITWGTSPLKVTISEYINLMEDD